MADTFKVRKSKSTFLLISLPLLFVVIMYDLEMPRPKRNARDLLSSWLFFSSTDSCSECNMCTGLTRKKKYNIKSKRTITSIAKFHHLEQVTHVALHLYSPCWIHNQTTTPLKEDSIFLRDILQGAIILSLALKYTCFQMLPDVVKEQQLSEKLRSYPG